MNTNEHLELSGRLHIELRGPDGALKDSREFDLLVAAQTRIRRTPGGVLADEVVDDIVDESIR